MRELAEWRLTEYLDRARTQTAGFSTLKVSQANGRPILFLPPEPERSDLPEGWTDVFVDDAAYSANFVKVAVNVVRESGDEDNQLPKILRRWFGPDAGAPGTRHAVALELKDNRWHLMPLGRRSGELQLWRSYSREEIPPLFGFEFSTAIWNAGFVKRPGHMFLLVTLDKSGSRIGVPVQGPFHQPKRVRVAEPESNWPGQRVTAGTFVTMSSEDSLSTCSSEAKRRWPAGRGAVRLLRRRAVLGVARRSTDYGQMEASD